MNEVIPGLWIGDLRSALNVENLKTHGIYSILTAMRGRISIHQVRPISCHIGALTDNWCSRRSFATKSWWTTPRMPTSSRTFCRRYTSSRPSWTRGGGCWCIARRASVSATYFLRRSMPTFHRPELYHRCRLSYVQQEYRPKHGSRADQESTPFRRAEPGFPATARAISRHAV